MLDVPRATCQDRTALGPSTSLRIIIFSNKIAQKFNKQDALDIFSNIGFFIAEDRKNFSRISENLSRMALSGLREAKSGVISLVTKCFSWLSRPWDSEYLALPSGTLIF